MLVFAQPVTYVTYIHTYISLIAGDDLGGGYLTNAK